MTTRTTSSTSLLAGFGSFPTYFRAAPRGQPARPPPATTTLPALAPLDRRRRSTGLVADGRGRRRRPPGRRRSPPVTSPGRCRSRCARCSPPGSAGSSSPTARSCSSSTTTRTAPSSSASASTIGHEHLVGELAGGIDAWAAAGRPGRHDPRWSSPTRSTGTVLDVRQADEYAAGHVPGARQRRARRARRRDRRRDGPVTVMCGHGERAMTGASILAAPRPPRRRACSPAAPTTGPPRPAARWRSADDDHRRLDRAAPIRLGLRENLAPVPPARRRQRARRRDDRPGTHRPAAARRARSSGSPRSPPRSRSSSPSAS